MFGKKAVLRRTNTLYRHCAILWGNCKQTTLVYKVLWSNIGVSVSRMTDWITRAIYGLAVIAEVVVTLFAVCDPLHFHLAVDPPTRGNALAGIVGFTTVFILFAIPQILRSMEDTITVGACALLVAALAVLGFIAYETARCIREGVPRSCPVHEDIVRRVCPRCSAEQGASLTSVGQFLP